MDVLALHTPRWHPLRRALVVGLSMVLALTGCGGDNADVSGAPRSTVALSSSTVTSMPAGDGAIKAGTYTIPSSDWSVVDFEITFPEGWTAQYGHVYNKHPDEADEFGLYAVVVDEIYTDACEGEGAPVEVGPRVDDLVNALLEQPGPVAGVPVATTLGNHPATRVDLSVPPGLDLESCRLWEDGVDGLQIWYSGPADKYFVVGSDSPASVYILDVDGERQVFVTQSHAGTSKEDLAELQAILDSIRIDA